MSIKSIMRNKPIVRAVREFLSIANFRENSPFSSIVYNLELSKISNVIDVGANIGQFGLDIRRHGYRGQIISYEPVRETFELLFKNTLRHQPWKAFQMALGAEESQLNINVSGNAALSSSILEMNALHLDNFPNSETVAKQRISISTLDTQLEILGLRPEEIMLKMDVQGFEAEVLKGATDSLSKIPLCYLEVSIAPLYEGEVLFLPILNELSKFGHEVIDVFRGIKAKDGKLLQLDILTRLSHI